MQYVNRQYPPTEEEKRQREEERAIEEAAMQLKNNRLGILIFQISWIMVFVCLLVVYWFMGYQDGWRPTAEQAPEALLPTVATLLLIASAFSAWQALKQAQAADPEAKPKDRKRFLGMWRLAMVLGVIFFGIMMLQFSAVPASTDGEQFGYLYKLMIGYHAIHAVAIAFMMWQVDRFARDGRYHADNFWSVEAAAKLWYFVVVAWLLFYPVLYLPYLGN